MPDMKEMGVPGASPAPSPSPMAPPAGTPTAAEPKASGEIEQAKANVQIAIAMLEQSLPIIGSDSEEGGVLLQALTKLSKTFGGKKSQDLVPAELMQVMSSMPDQYKQAMAPEAAGQPAGIPGGPHAPANLGV